MAKSLNDYSENSQKKKIFFEIINFNEKNK